MRNTTTMKKEDMSYEQRKKALRYLMFLKEKVTAA